MSVALTGLTHDQALMVEAVAAQLYERHEVHYSTARRVRFWSELDEGRKHRWRQEAKRKLLTGEIDGWQKVGGTHAQRLSANA